MFKPLSDLFTEKTRGEWASQDVKIFIQDWLRKQARSEKIYCIKVEGTCAYIRVGSPTVFQEIHILQHDLSRTLKDVANFNLSRVSVVAAYY